jgi:hypothetical protein
VASHSVSLNVRAGVDDMASTTDIRGGLGTVGGFDAREAMTLHTTGITFTFRCPGDINKGGVLEYIHAQHLADGKFLSRHGTQ